MSSMSNPNVELLRRAWAAFDQFDFEAFGASLAEDWREHDSGGNVVSTREQERQTMELQRSAFPDRHTEIHWIVADSELVACRCTITSTHSGTYLDAAPTGKVARDARDDVQPRRTWTSCRNLGNERGREPL